MRRLIDADALKIPSEETVAKMAVALAPTIDAVPVVRCKDCRFSHMTYGGECKSCDMWKDDDDFTMTLYLDGDFYCAFAERREDEIG